MKKQEAVFYPADHIQDEIPQKIIAYFERFSRIMQGEQVLAVFGSLAGSTDSIENSALVLKDRIEYAETMRFSPKLKSVTFEFIDQVYLLSEGNIKYVSIVDISKNSTSFKIGSSITNATVFYNLLRQMKTGSSQKEDTVVTSKGVECPNCGANCIIYKGQETHCQYCGSPIAWQ